MTHVDIFNISLLEAHNARLCISYICRQQHRFSPQLWVLLRVVIEQFIQLNVNARLVFFFRPGMEGHTSLLREVMQALLPQPFSLFS